MKTDTIYDAYNCAKASLKRAAINNRKIRKDKKFTKDFFSYLEKNKGKVKFDWEKVDFPHFTSEKTQKSLLCKTHTILDYDGSKLKNNDQVFEVYVDFLNSLSSEKFYLYEVTCSELTMMKLVESYTPTIKVIGVPRTIYRIRFAKETEENTNENI